MPTSADHNLVTAKIRLKFRNAKIGTNNSKRFDVTKLKDPVVREEFNITLRNRYSALRDKTAITIDKFHQAMNDAATEAISYKNPQNQNGYPKTHGTPLKRGNN